jgi:hypothetical protein
VTLSKEQQQQHYETRGSTQTVGKEWSVGYDSHIPHIYPMAISKIQRVIIKQNYIHEEDKSSLNSAQVL